MDGGKGLENLPSWGPVVPKSEHGDMAPCQELSERGRSHPGRNVGVGVGLWIPRESPGQMDWGGSSWEWSPGVGRQGHLCLSSRTRSSSSWS